MPPDPPRAANPRKVIFDPFNSSATGHQRADNSLSSSTAWRDSRLTKLQQQFSSSAGGGKRVNDTVGAGSLDFGRDGRTANGGFERGAKGLRTGGQQSLWESMGIIASPGEIDPPAIEHPPTKIPTEGISRRSTVVNPFTPFRYGNGRVRETSWTAHEATPSELLDPLFPAEHPPRSPTSPKAAAGDSSLQKNDDCTLNSDLVDTCVTSQLPQPKLPQIFANLTFYINGSTAPLSDHHLKRLLSSHGGRVSVALGRRSVTHVILGRPSSHGGSGGGLAGNKIQKEITRIGGKGIKFVTADWIAESVKAGKRLPESRFEALKLAPKGVSSAASMFKSSEDA